MDEEPDVRYRADDVLPEILGPSTHRARGAHYAFCPDHPAILFCPDLLSHGAGEDLAFVPAGYHEAPELTRQSVRQLLNLDFAVLCFDHGVPILDNPTGLHCGHCSRPTTATQQSRSRVDSSLFSLLIPLMTGGRFEARHAHAHGIER